MNRKPRSPGLYKLMSSGKPLLVSKGDMIGSTAEGHKMYMIISGYVKRYFITTSGSIGLQLVYVPTDIFFLSKIYREVLNLSIYDGPETYYYEAMSDASLLTLDIGVLKTALDKDPALYKELLAEAGYHLRTSIYRLENISLPSIYARVAHQLLFAAEEDSAKTDDGVKINVPLTHQDIADILGATRATVTLAINRLRKEGVLLPGRQLVITDLKALEKQAYSNLDAKNQINMFNIV
ncbi:MAG TPA: Crp/Fnr family transcriptional regulator [Candidatus Saccharimonadales bacterium]|nr:Crp/Fnr family transcriptional regulator [Candidatus Saccharimonadales bacterium]